ncbi:FliO/MopB family protein, partial [Isoptericola sp. NPDC057391]|uniref:FliO/MopB family protein n=1 Tax=Isoptericola sp. NPDC057391 TaxID=3346117 RepID=UPI00362FD0FF
MDLTTVLRVVFSLGVVLALLWFSHRVAGRRTRAVARSGGERLAVLARQGLTQKSAAVLLEAGGRRYLLGVTESSVTVIDRPEVRAAQPGGASDGAFDGTFDDTFDDVVAALAAQDEEDPHDGAAGSGAPDPPPHPAP